MRILPPGKLPNDLLQQFLETIVCEDPSVLVGPGVGEDAAIVDWNGDLRSEDLLVLKTDPITFAADRIGYYAVCVNANDIASTGADPRWFLTTLLFPKGISAEKIAEVAREIEETATEAGITVCGGHTEITTAVSRPVICGAMIGTVSRDVLKRKESVRPGQRIIMTKTAGNEGTAILARELPEMLARKGISAAELDAAGRFLDRLSVLPEARIARSIPGVAAMHDVTEGGVATALSEIVAATGCGLSVKLDNVPTDLLTAALCRATDLDPFGLIGSGSLLVAIEEGSVERLLESLHAANIPAAVVASVTEPGAGLTAFAAGAEAPFPRFERDEIARVFG